MYDAYQLRGESTENEEKERERKEKKRETQRRQRDAASRRTRLRYSDHDGHLREHWRK